MFELLFGFIITTVSILIGWCMGTASKKKEDA